jgi:chromosome segregation ATPase
MILLDWLFLTVVILTVAYLYFQMLHYKNMHEKEEQQSGFIEQTLHEAEALIRKYQLQMQRSLGDIGVLNEELAKMRNDLKAMKSRSSQCRIENERLKSQIKNLEAKIEALL